MFKWLLSTAAGLAGFARLCAGDQYEVSFSSSSAFFFVVFCNPYFFVLRFHSLFTFILCASGNQLLDHMRKQNHPENGENKLISSTSVCSAWELNPEHSCSCNCATFLQYIIFIK